MTENYIKINYKIVKVLFLNFYFLLTYISKIILIYSTPNVKNKAKYMYPLDAIMSCFYN